MVNLLTALVLAGWIVVVSILAIQNATPVALSFLGLQSVQIPVGLVLTFSVALGAVGMGVLQLLWGLFAGEGSDQEDYVEGNDEDLL